MVVSENGLAKKTSLKEYRRQKRGGRGIKTVRITQKTGWLVKAHLVTNEEIAIITSLKGQVIKITLSSIPVLSRSTQGIRIMKLNEGDKVVSIALL